jgi:integrase
MAVYRHQKKWMYDFWKNKIRHQQWGYRTRQEAKIAEAEARKNLKAMNSGFIELCERRLKELDLRRTTKYFKANKRLIEKLILLWSYKKEIKRQDIVDYFEERKRGSPYVANADLRMMKALFNCGIENEMINYNPAEKIKFVPMRRRKKYIPSSEDVKKVLELANPEQRSYLIVLINTMARVGEINQLKWEDIHNDFLILKTKKSKNSNVVERVIPMNSIINDTLRHIKRYDEYVFINPVTGKPYDYRSKFLKTLCIKAKVKPFTFHCIRHYGATKLDQAGVALCDIQTLLGHQSPTTTSIYLQSVRKSLIEAVKKLI